MEIIFALFPFIILPTVFGIFIYMFIKKGRLLDIEKGQNALFSETCSGVIGWLSFRGPFIRLSLYEDFLVIAYYKSIVLNYDQLKGVSEKRWGLVKYIHIEHVRPDCPRKIMLYSTNRKKVIELLKSKIQ